MVTSTLRWFLVVRDPPAAPAFRLAAAVEAVPVDFAFELAALTNVSGLPVFGMHPLVGRLTGGVAATAEGAQLALAVG